jgi:hypothetical protein
MRSGESAGSLGGTGGGRTLSMEDVGAAMCIPGQQRKGKGECAHVYSRRRMDQRPGTGGRYGLLLRGALGDARARATTVGSAEAAGGLAKKPFAFVGGSPCESRQPSRGAAHRGGRAAATLLRGLLQAALALPVDRQAGR